MKATEVERFRAHCRKRGTHLLWRSARQFRLANGQRKQPAHAAWLLFHGPVPDGHGVTRICDHPDCVSHLACLPLVEIEHFWGVKQRRLTVDQVRRVRALPPHGGRRCYGVLPRLAREWGVPLSLLYNVRYSKRSYRECW
jgi:hypothetical protein